MMKMYTNQCLSLKRLLLIPCSAHKTLQLDTVGPFAPPPDSGNMSQRQLWGFKSTIAGAASLCRTSPLCPRVMPFSSSIPPKPAAAHHCKGQQQEETSLPLSPAVQVAGPPTRQCCYAAMPARPPCPRISSLPCPSQLFPLGTFPFDPTHSIPVLNYCSDFLVPRRTSLQCRNTRPDILVSS